MPHFIVDGAYVFIISHVWGFTPWKQASSRFLTLQLPAVFTNIPTFLPALSLRCVLGACLLVFHG